jgi:hypothetical protein
MAFTFTFLHIVYYVKKKVSKRQLGEKINLGLAKPFNYNIRISYSYYKQIYQKKKKEIKDIIIYSKALDNYSNAQTILIRLTVKKDTFTIRI